MSMVGFSNQVPITGRVRQCLEMVRQQDLKGKVVLDVGASVGWLEEQLENSGAKLVGIEPNAQAVEFARKKIGKKARFEVGSALQIPEPSNSVDITVFFDVLEHVPVGTESKALGEINRVLKIDGILLLTTPNHHIISNLLDPAWYFGHRHYKSDHLEKLINQAGFKIVSHDKRGGFLSVFHMVWFYTAKWILMQNQPHSNIIDELDDQSYNTRNGFVSHFLIAKKI